MKIGKNIFILVFLILILLVSGCKSNNKDNPANIENVKISTNPNGIVPSISIGTNDKLKIGRPVSVYVKVENEGAQDTEDIIIARVKSCGAITKSDWQNYKLEEFTQEDVQKNKKKYAEIVLDGLLASAVTKECKIYADVCYTYTTKLIHEISFGSNSKKYTIPTQGSPINVKAITRDVYQDTGGAKRVEFKIEYENKGGGMVIRQDKYDKKCESGLENSDLEFLDAFEFNAHILSRKLNCFDEDGKTDLFKLNYIDTKKNYLICEIPQDILTPEYYKEGSTEKLILDITMTYGYYKAVVKNVIIES
jgi:hypothetical protein